MPLCWGYPGPFCSEASPLSTKWSWNQLSRLQNGKAINHGGFMCYKMVVCVNRLGSLTPQWDWHVHPKKCAHWLTENLKKEKTCFSHWANRGNRSLTQTYIYKMLHVLERLVPYKMATWFLHVKKLPWQISITWILVFWSLTEWLGAHQASCLQTKNAKTIQTVQTHLLQNWFMWLKKIINHPQSTVGGMGLPFPVTDDEMARGAWKIWIFRWKPPSYWGSPISGNLHLRAVATKSLWINNLVGWVRDSPFLGLMQSPLDWVV